MRYLWVLLFLLLIGGGTSLFDGSQDRPVATAEVIQPSIPVVPESSGAGTTATGVVVLVIAVTAYRRLRSRH